MWIIYRVEFGFEPCHYGGISYHCNAGVGGHSDTGNKGVVMQRRTLVVGNWKMNGLLAFAQTLANEVRVGISERAHNKALSCDVVLCPPFTALSTVRLCLEASTVQFGAQTMSEHTGGPFTGDISGAMLHDVGCRHVILGHSERCAEHTETNEGIARTMAAAFREGLIPIVCLGESLEERNAGETLEVVASQLHALLAHLPEEKNQRESLVLAYEPVWAIGTGRHATPQQAQEVHAFVRQQLSSHVHADMASNVRILYGGSMTAHNAKELLSQQDVDGGLIGGASLKAADFLAIVDACSP